MVTVTISFLDGPAWLVSGIQKSTPNQGSCSLILPSHLRVEFGFILHGTRRLFVGTSSLTERDINIHVTVHHDFNRPRHRSAQGVDCLTRLPMFNSFAKRTILRCSFPHRTLFFLSPSLDDILCYSCQVQAWYYVGPIKTRGHSTALQPGEARG
jgi:hypothetical protein